METQPRPTVPLWPDLLIAAGIFLAAFIPRVVVINRYITGDEPRWVVRSTSFLTGLLTGQLELTLATGHPGVTTMWSGSTGLVLDYLINHQSAGNLLTFVRGLPLDPEHINAAVLPWMRLPIVTLSSLCAALLFWLFKPVDKPVALVAALLLAFHPIYLGNSLLLHHDALVSVFITLSVIPFLMSMRAWSWPWLIFSGAMAGLAILSKSTAYALLPFIALVLLIEVVKQRLPRQRAVWGGLIWGITALIIVLALWPALWVMPVAAVQTVFGWINASADVTDVSNTLLPSFSRWFPDLGLLFYPVNWALKSTPLTLAGLIAFVFWWKETPRHSPMRWWAAHLLLWIGIFSLMLTVGDKRDGRYLLPIYFAVCILAALGLSRLYQKLKRFQFFAAGAGTGILLAAFSTGLLLFSVAYFPYYLAYYNPLLGGPWLAPRLIKVGLGDGMEQAAAWLNTRPAANRLRVATELPQTFAPLFSGQATNPSAADPFSADYTLIYIRQIQNGDPFGEFFHYYGARTPIYQLKVAGIDFIRLHSEPPLASLGRIPFSDDLILRAYTLDRPLAAPGAPLTVTLIWRAEFPVNESIRLKLQDQTGRVWAESTPAPAIDPAGPSNVEGHYTLNLPADTPRGNYQLWGAAAEGNWTEIVSIPVGRTAPPEAISNPVEANFSHQIALHGFDFSRSAAAPETVRLTLHWQALASIPNSYTTFIHLRDGSGNTVAQADVLPGQGQWLTNTWRPGEWISDPITLFIPPDTPPGKYQIVAGWYHLETGQRLPLVHNDLQNVVVLKTIIIE